jgi:hypothetical protein
MLYYVCIVLMRVDEQATVESEVQQVEVAEQELVEGKFEREMCPWAISKYFGDLVPNIGA